MKIRIVTHGNCTDGFSSAFIFIKYMKYFIGKEAAEIEIVGVQPREIQLGEFELTQNDVVLDLPYPKTKVLFWCDHHITSKKDKFPKNYFWKEAPSNTGFLIEVAVKNGLKETKELQEFKRAIDIMDSANYSKEDIKDCYYLQENYDSPTFLQKMQMISSMFNTRDYNLNEQIFKTLLLDDLGETPLSSKAIWKLNPLMFYQAELIGYREWRGCVEEYLEYDEKAKCVIQDNRKLKFIRGNYDRFFVFMKFEPAAYSISVRVVDENDVRLGVGSNIFHKERCKVDIGKLCRKIGKKFGAGSGGGHYYVGGCSVDADKVDAAVEEILKIFKEVM